MSGWNLEDDNDTLNLEKDIKEAKESKGVAKKEKDSELNLKKLTNQLNKAVDPNVKIIKLDHLQFPNVSKNKNIILF